MDENNVKTENEQLDKEKNFVIHFLYMVIVLGILGFIGRLIVSLICTGAEAGSNASHNKAVKKVTKLFYKRDVKKEELTDKERKKLILAAYKVKLFGGAPLEKVRDYIDNSRAEVRFLTTTEFGHTMLKKEPNLIVIVNNDENEKYGLPTLKECGINDNYDELYKLAKELFDNRYKKTDSVFGGLF